MRKFRVFYTDEQSGLSRNSSYDLDAENIEEARKIAKKDEDNQGPDYYITDIRKIKPDTPELDNWKQVQGEHDTITEFIDFVYGEVTADKMQCNLRELLDNHLKIDRKALEKERRELINDR